MTSVGKVIAMVLWAISLLCLIFTALVHKNNSKSKLLKLICVSGSVICLAGLSGLAYDNEKELARARITEFKKPPSIPCFIQGIVVEYAANVTLMAAVCFTHQTYRLLVKLKTQDIQDERRMKIYYSLIFGYSTIMIIPLSVFSAKYNAIQPRGSGCDVYNPQWIRLLGYSGSTLVTLIPGIYFSSCAALVVLRHSGQFKYETEQQPSKDPPWDKPFDIESGNPSTKNQSLSDQTSISQPQISIIHHQSNVTLVAAIRMIIFTLMFALICLISSIQTLIVILKDEKVKSDKIAGQDFSAGLLGIVILLLFGINSQSKRYLSKIKGRISGKSGG